MSCLVTGILAGGFSAAAFERCADVARYRSRLVAIDYVSSPSPSMPTVYLQPAASRPVWSDAQAWRISLATLCNCVNARNRASCSAVISPECGS